MWLMRILEALFPGEQLKVLLGIIAVFALIIVYGVVDAKLWQRDGGSAVFFTKQRFQSLFRSDDDADE